MKLAEAERPAEEPAPGPRAAAVDDVVLAELLVVGAEEARPRDHLADEDVGEPAEGGDVKNVRTSDLPTLQPVVVVEPVVDGRAGEDGDEGRDPRQPAELVRKLCVGLGELRGERPTGSGRDYRRWPWACRLAPIDAEISSRFHAEQIDRARRYHRPRSTSRSRVGLALGLATLAAPRRRSRTGGSVRGGSLRRFSRRSPSRSRRSSGCRSIVWRGWVHERRWGFSTQSRRGFAADILKKLLVTCVLAAIARRRPSSGSRARFPRGGLRSPLRGAALLVLVVGFVAPVVLEPLFNRFAPLEDERLAGELVALADAGGVPVRDVLVADASRRTRR